MQKHIAIVPLIGGMAIGAEMELGCPPEAVFSYDAFELNDSFLRAWYSKRELNVPYISLDQHPAYEPDFGEIDLVTSVCPCSGLSAANTSAGAGCQQNEWMYKSTEWALSKIRPKVLVGENAPRLYGSFGQLVALKLRDIAARYGYLLTLVKTSTHFHGIPQKRERSFFVLLRDTELPPIFNRDQSFYDGTWMDYLDSFKDDDSKGLESRSEHNDEMWKILLEGTKLSKEEIRDLIITTRSSLLTQICMHEPELRDKYIDEYIESEDKVKASLARKFHYTREKMKKSGCCNVWDTSPYFTSALYFPSVMYKTVCRVHHNRDVRTLTPREQMRLMGLPETMDVPRSYLNAIAQNVPTCTARWICREALAAVEGRRPVFTDELVGDRIFRQSNLNGTTTPGMGAGQHLTKLIEAEEVKINHEFALV